MLRSIFQNALALPKLQPISARLMSIRARKRFYKSVSVVSNGNGQYELTLDHRKLKTPLGSVLTINNESLAHAVAHEWRSQKDLIMLSQMHLNGLANVCTDNPTQTTKYALVDSILAFLDTDTILFFGDRAEWQPIIDWFCERHGIQIKPSENMSSVPEFSADAKETVRRYLLSHSFDVMQGFTFGVDAVKSIVLMCAVVEKRLTVKEAVKLSRLELEVQTERWGNVEWAHDLELHDTTARLAAAAIFVQLNRIEEKTIDKNAQAF